MRTIAREERSNLFKNFGDQLSNRILIDAPAANSGERRAIRDALGVQIGAGVLAAPKVISSVSSF